MTSRPAQAATCASYSDQAAAQRAHDTRDADGDGVYCESLPCPCADGNGGGGSRQPAAPSRGTTTGCTRPRGVVPIGFSATKYPHIRAHVQRALRRGWPSVLVLNRPFADARRERLLSGRATRPGMDRDEYPRAVGRGRGAHLARGSKPTRLARGRDVRAERREPLARLDHGIKLRRFCDGTRFKYVFY